MKRLILGMSMSKSDLAAWIDNHTFQTIVALAQLYLFPSGNRTHWRKEVWEKFSRIYTLKHSNKLPSAQFILQHSWNAHKNHIARIIQYAKDKEEKYSPIEGATLDEFYQVAEDYFIWLADMLSRHNEVLLQEVKDELDRLGLDEVDPR